MSTPYLTPSFIEEMKHKLLTERQRLEAELAGLPGHMEIGSRSDENAKEAEEDEVHQSIINRIQNDLAKIAKALSKIESGAYGSDDEGRPIGKERLRALPWADKAI